MDPQRQLDAALDQILAQALRSRGRAIELHDMLMGPDSDKPGNRGRASAFATLIELDVNELVRQVERLVSTTRSSVPEVSGEPCPTKGCPLPLWHTGPHHGGPVHAGCGKSDAVQVQTSGLPWYCQRCRVPFGAADAGELFPPRVNKSGGSDVEGK